MTINLFDAKGTPLSQQKFTWKELVQEPISKLDDDAFTRVRIILMNGMEQQANRFSHLCSQMNGELRQALALVRRTGRDPAEILPERMPDPIAYESQREFVRNTLEREINLRTSGTDFVSRENESEEFLAYRRYMNSEGSPSTSVAEGYHWRPGTELNRSRQAA